MNVTELIIGILAGIGIIGVIGLLLIGKVIDPALAGIVSLLVGYLVGKKNDAILGVFGIGKK